MQLPKQTYTAWVRGAKEETAEAFEDATAGAAARRFAETVYRGTKLDIQVHTRDAVGNHRLFRVTLTPTVLSKVHPVEAKP